jgi:hypothetical protein
MDMSKATKPSTSSNPKSQGRIVPDNNRVRLLKQTSSRFHQIIVTTIDLARITALRGLVRP